MAYRHVEMIIDYATDGTDFWYNDNRGGLVRCKDCKHYVPREPCVGGTYEACDFIVTGGGCNLPTTANDYCSHGERMDGKPSNMW